MPATNEHLKTYSTYSDENTSNYNNKPQQNKKWHNLTFDPSKKSLSDFPEEPIECAERAFGPLAQENERQFAICQIISTSQTVNQPSFLRKRHMRTKRCSLRKRTRIEWVGNRRRHTYSHDDNHKNIIKQTDSTTECQTAKNKMTILQKTRTSHQEMWKRHSQRSRTTR